jgi:tRNA(Ile)-lysidine synthase
VGDRDALWVKTWGKRKGLRVVVGRAHKSGRTGEGEARELRWGFFRKAMRRIGVKQLWLAQQADDQAETVLMQLLRGAGPDGLAGMAVRSKQIGLEVVRPLLGLTREEVRRAAKEVGLSWREDKTNEDERGWRSRIRRRVLPYLAKIYGRDVRGALCRAAEIFAGEKEYWKKELRKIPNQPDVREWRKKPIAWQRRAIRIWLGRQGYGGPSFAEVEGMRKLILAESTATCQLGRSLLVKRKKGRLFLGKGLPIRLV